MKFDKNIRIISCLKGLPHAFQFMGDKKGYAPKISIVEVHLKKLILGSDQGGQDGGHGYLEIMLIVNI